MTGWQDRLERLVRPAVNRSSLDRSAAIREVVIAPGAVAAAGAVAARCTDRRTALLAADEAGFAVAGPATRAALAAAGFRVETVVLPARPRPVASVAAAAPFRVALAANPALFPVAVGSGVINDLVKYAAFQTDGRYMSVATAASMDGYASAGAPLQSGHFKTTIPTRAPVAILADLTVIAAAPAVMNGWGYGDLAGKSPAGGDWLLADLVGAEPVDDTAFPLVQDHLHGWLGAADGIARGDIEAVAGLFTGLVAVGFAMACYGSSRPASGLDHQIAHLWEMEGLTHDGRKVAHGAAVAVGCMITLALYDWLLAQPLTGLDTEAILGQAPGLGQKIAATRQAIADPEIAGPACEEVAAKHVTPAVHRARLDRIRAGWAERRVRLRTHLFRTTAMDDMLRRAGAPRRGADLGLSGQHLVRTLRAAPFLRRRYTIADFLQDVGLWEAAVAALSGRGVI